MKKLILAAGLASGLVFLCTGDVSGHGGSYRGPGDTVPGGGTGPGTPGNGNPGPVTPGPGGGPNTPGGGRGPNTPGGGPAAPGGGAAGGRGPVTPGGGGKKNAAGEGYEQWSFWWENNKDPYLDLKARLGDGAVVSGGQGFLTGRGSKETVSASKRPTSEEVNQRIIPTLKSVLDEQDADIVDSAVLAIGRIVRTESAALVLDDLKNALGNSNPSVQQSAILAMGVLGSKEAIPVLIEVLNDTDKGREFLKARSAIPNFQRSFAAVSIGYIGAAETIPVLKQVIDDNKQTDINIKALSLVALGLFSENKEEIVQYLMDKLKDNKLQADVVAQVPISLARLGSAADVAVVELQKLLKSRKIDDRMEESCIIALGELAKPEDKEVIEALQDTIKDGKNDQARHFAFVSLAEIGGRAAKEAENHEELLKDLNKFFIGHLTKPERAAQKPWAGLALALMSRNFADSTADRSTAITKLAEAFESESNPSYKSCFAISLGLLNARSAGNALLDVLKDSKDTGLQGYCAVALGMMRQTDALEVLRTMVKDDKDAKLRLQVATALGLMGDVGAVDTLVTALKSAVTLNVISSLAKALGLIGDKSCIEPLEAIIGDQKAPALARGFGCVALGLIGEKTDLPWNWRIAVSTNYRTEVPALYEILDIL